LVSLQFVGDGEKLGAMRVWPAWHHLIRSSTQGGGNTKAPLYFVRITVNHQVWSVFIRIQHGLCRWGKVSHGLPPPLVPH
jgi:hypothetical protein